jgi:ClpP class serine protease
MGEGINILHILFFIFFLVSLGPLLKQRTLESRRIVIMKNLERKRKSRFIALIHRQESISIFGFPLTKYINIEDSEQILRAIRLTPPNMPIDLLLHTPGGLVLASEQIAHAIRKHPAKTTVFVPHYSMSGGTLIAMAADEIIMDENAVLGPTDPQIGKFPAGSILKVLETKNIDNIDDETIILADIARKAINQVKKTVIKLLQTKLDKEKAEELAEKLTGGYWTHDYPLTCEELTKLGFPVCGTLPEEIYQLMDYYPQPQRGRPSIQFNPSPNFDRN